MVLFPFSSFIFPVWVWGKEYWPRRLLLTRRSWFRAGTGARSPEVEPRFHHYGYVSLGKLTSSLHIRMSLSDSGGVPIVASRFPVGAVP